MLIEIKDLYKIYNEGKESEVRALDGVTLHIDRGEFVAIVGQSGSGKSTLMNVLGCLDIPTYGEYHLNGTDVTSLSDKQLAHIRNREIGFIFQGYNLIQELDALENVDPAPDLSGGVRVATGRTSPWRRWKRWAWRSVPTTGPVRCPAASSSGWPSPGPSPPIPPSSWRTSPPALWTPGPAEHVLEILRGLYREGTTILLITHDDGIAATARRVVRLSDGKIIADHAQEVDWE